MSVVEMKSLLEAGVHFGHQTHRWNPKMKKYIFIKRNGIHIIDLKQTLETINQAYYYLKDLAASGKHVLFVGTKKQASEGIENAAIKCGEYYISNRWYGGTLTNLRTIRKSIEKLDKFEELQQTGEINKFTKLEVLRMQRKYDKINSALGGIRDLETLPGALFIADTVNEKNAVNEAKKLGIPIVAIVDTNSDPDGIDYCIPGNDDAMKSVNLIADIMANAILEGKRIASEGKDVVAPVDEEMVAKSENESNPVSEPVVAPTVSEKKSAVKPKKETKTVTKKTTEDVAKTDVAAAPKQADSEEQKEGFECPYCGKVLSSKRGLKIHLGLVHQK